MHDGLGEQIVESSIVTALCGGGIDLEQRFGFGTAHWLIGHNHRRQDMRTPGGVLSIDRTGKMNAAPHRRARCPGHILRGPGHQFLTSRRRRSVRQIFRQRHTLIVLFFFQTPPFSCGHKRVVNVTSPFAPSRFESGRAELIETMQGLGDASPDRSVLV
jgi:hypothetical protein